MPLVPHAKFGFLLLLVLIFTLLVFGAARFRLSKVIGVSFVCMYGLFLLYTYMQVSHVCVHVCMCGEDVCMRVSVCVCCVLVCEVCVWALSALHLRAGQCFV